MAKVKYDVRGVESGGDFDSPVPAGLYRAKVSEIEQRESKSSGNQMLAITYEISKGDHKGRLAWDYIVLGVESQAWKLRQFLEAVGAVKGKKERGTLDTDKIVGTEIQLKLKHETDDTYGTRHKVGSVMPMPEDEDDDLDEDDDDLDDDDIEDDDIDDEEDDDEEDDDEEEEADDDEDDETYDDWSVDELKAELKERGLKTAGKKSVLVSRLEKDDEEADDDDEPF
jgi:hypothetical protein